jgi:hypothetical protein
MCRQGLKTLPSSNPISNRKSQRNYSIIPEPLLLRDEQRIDKKTKATVQWQQRVLDYLQLLDAWDGKSETSEADVFNQKSGLYLALISITPAGTTADPILSSYIQLLSREGPMKENRILWMLHANKAFRLVAARQGAERSKMLELLLYSKNPVREMIKARLF